MNELTSSPTIRPRSSTSAPAPASSSTAPNNSSTLLCWWEEELSVECMANTILLQLSFNSKTSDCGGRKTHTYLVVARSRSEVRMALACGASWATVTVGWPRCSVARQEAHSGSWQLWHHHPTSPSPCVEQTRVCATSRIPAALASCQKWRRIYYTFSGVHVQSVRVTAYMKRPAGEFQITNIVGQLYFCLKATKFSFWIWGSHEENDRWLTLNTTTKYIIIILVVRWQCGVLCVSVVHERCHTDDISWQGRSHSVPQPLPLAMEKRR